MATYHIIESAPRRLLDAVFFEHNRLQCINACDIYCLTGKLKLPKEAVSTWAYESALQAKRCSGLCNVPPTLVAQDIQHFIDCNQCWIAPKLAKEKITSLCHAKINLASAKTAGRSVCGKHAFGKATILPCKNCADWVLIYVLVIIFVFCVGYFFTWLFFHLTKTCKYYWLSCFKVASHENWCLFSTITFLGELISWVYISVCTVPRQSHCACTSTSFCQSIAPYLTSLRLW